jgi:uroporphyrinogen decarboxylase
VTSREIVARALNHKEPGRVPIAFGGCHDSIHVIGHRKLKEYLNLEGGIEEIQDPFQQIVFPDTRLLERFGSDTLAVYPNLPNGFELEYKEEGEYLTYTDEWGTKYRQPKIGGLYFDFTDHVLAGKTIDEVKAFPFPDPIDPGRFHGLRQRVEQLHKCTDKAIIAYSPTPGIFESTYWLRSFEEAYIDMAWNVPLLETLTSRLLDWMLQFWEVYLKEIV